MCFKKLRSLKNLCNFTPEDFEYKPSYSSQLFKMRTYLPDEETKSYEFNFPFSSFYDPPKPISYNVHIEIIPKEPEIDLKDLLTWKDKYDFSREGETAVTSGTSLLKDYDEPGKAKCSECGYIRNTPHEMYLLPLDNGKHKFVCIYCYKEEESN